MPAVAAASVAVLPLASASVDPDRDYVARGVTELLHSALTGVRSLRVASRGAAAARHGRVSSADLGQALEVESILEGSVGTQGGHLRLAVRLCAASTGAILWSEQLDRGLDELFIALREISERILESLQVEATEAERRVLDHVATRDPVALDDYLRARDVTEEIRRASQEVAVQLYGDATVADPNFALAHAGLANAHALLFTYWISSDEHLQAAAASSARAIALAPELAPVHVARAIALSLTKDYDAAEKEFQIALDRAPTSFDANYHYARHCRATGRVEDSARWFAAAAALRPEDYAVPALLASVYTGLQRPEDARLAQGRALALAEERLKQVPDDERALYLGAGCLSSLGDPGRAREWARRAVAMEPDDSAVLYNVACVYSLLGLKDSAIDCLEQAIANGFGHWDWITHDSDLDGLRAHPRFLALTTR
jgi:adenylate cyclase